MELAQLQEQVVALTYEESLLRNELKRVSDENKELASENAALKVFAFDLIYDLTRLFE